MIPLVLAATLAVPGAGPGPAAEAPPVLFIADRRESPGECGALTLFARLLAGEIDPSDLQDPYTDQDELCALFRAAALPGRGGAAPEIAAAGAARGHARAVAGAVANPGARTAGAQADAGAVVATCILL